MLKQIFRNRERKARARRVRAKISGTAERPRLSVFRSLRTLSVQVIDDLSGKTVLSASIRDLGKDAKNTVEGAFLVGKLIGEKCLAQGVRSVVFDRSGYRYHGKVKAVADGAREAGLQF
ncbi:MAG: 50S ribosomal protein L18 [Candidatus Moranbacteria bacterium]|nr:50S ribosomal protein L18 [Candidatus Moranbacteria bacterium]NTW46154.1 50S ribosomal protein L18 [Candidatus Moranbacteria bacterium]